MLHFQFFEGSKKVETKKKKKTNGSLQQVEIEGAEESSTEIGDGKELN